MLHLDAAIQSLQAHGHGTAKSMVQQTLNANPSLFLPPLLIRVRGPIPRQSQGSGRTLARSNRNRISARPEAKCASPRELCETERRDYCLGVPRGARIASRVRGEIVQPAELRHLECF